MDTSIDDYERLQLSPIKGVLIDDYDLDYNRNQIEKKKDLEMESLMMNNSNMLIESLSMLSVRESEKGEITVDNKYYQMLSDSFDIVYPLFYFTTEQRQVLSEKIQFNIYKKKTLLYSGMPDLLDNGNNFSCYILLKGEIHIFSNHQTFLDLITDITLFGYDGPIFQKRISTVIVEKDSVIGNISKEDFIQLLQPFSQFATFISRNIRYKDKILDNLMDFRSFVLSSIDKGPIDMITLMHLYQSFKPCIHLKCNSNEIDMQAWIYALFRLPPDIFETYVFVLINKPSRLLSLSRDLTNKLMPRLITVSRNRDIYKYLGGKNLVVVRDLETDVLDFVCNLCIQLIESNKIRKTIYSPTIIQEIHQVKDNFEETINVLSQHTKILFTQKVREDLFQLFGNCFAQKLLNLCLNYQDISVTINKQFFTDKDSIENWIQQLWNFTRKALGVSTSWLTQIDDLVVDIFQGSRRTLLNCFSSHMYINRDKILSWAKNNNIQLKTQSFLTETDKLIAYAMHYYKTFPEEEQKKRELNEKNGISVVEKTYSTGVRLLIINVNKLDKNNVGPGLIIKPASKNHVILHIGYTFGNQSHDIFKPVLMLFGTKARSLNIIGKCGGLIGKTGDLMVSTQFFLDKTHDVVSVLNSKMEVNKLKCLPGATVHVGPFLTVAGTILQNNDLLNFYKIVMGCIGIEMEGYYFAREIENSVKHKLLSEKFIMRSIYYVIDIPTDPNLVLSQERGNHCWEEGVSTVNAVKRFLLNEIMK